MSQPPSAYRPPVPTSAFGRLRALLDARVLVLDGAMGTMIQRYGLGEADFRGERLADHGRDQKGNSDVLVLTRPDVIGAIHRPGTPRILVVPTNEEKQIALDTLALLD